MPVVMNSVTCRRLLGDRGGGVGIGEWMLNRFSDSQRGRTGSYADRERGWLEEETGTSGLGRMDLWNRYLGKALGTKVGSDGFGGTAALTRAKHTYWCGEGARGGVGVVEGDGTFSGPRKRFYLGLNDGTDAPPVVVMGGTYSKTEGV
jgi:hypothetical protein